jgi:spore coat polysaccharide biosynthesis predicted glycosyltransferase SpsG
VAERMARLTPGPGQSLHRVPPTGALPTLIASADLVVSAAGTSTWELCCLGAPSALVCVVDNQRESYHRVVAAGLADGLGELPALAGDGQAARAAAHTLTELLADGSRRAALSARARAAVDGRGRARVVDAVLDALRRRQIAQVYQSPC